ncbi:MAG: DNA recombination protein RmuC [Bacteroidetes bacterium]|nr:DNA recombination protein RmuC [Bacteroidota bacterium]
MEILFLIIGILLGAVTVWMILKSKLEAAKGIPPEEAEALKAQINNLNVELSKSEVKNKLIEENLKQASNELNSERAKVLQLSSELSSLKSDYSNLQNKLDEQKSELEKLQEKFTKEFENLANKILDEKSTKFTQQNKDNLDQILKPLNDKIKDFEKKVDDVYVADSKERAGLIQQIKTLHELNQQMSKDAANLTNALKGQTKTQGNWGEFILESILEKSGLVKGREYLVQESMTTESGKRFQPDVLVNLPENKTIVIDSKVTLVAYEKYCSGEDENERSSALREHILSIKNHIKNLSSKNYQQLYQIQSLDFVLMFLPVEPAFSLAVQYEAGIFNEAFEKNIVIVSPSTLLATLRTIASIWRQENQNKNALEIARQSGALYDKFVGFVDDLINVGNKIDAAKGSYSDAMKKLHEGSGNLVSRAEKIKILGAKTTKSLPKPLLDRTDNDEEAQDLLS